MSVYKDELRNTWYVSCRYKDWKGETHQKIKRGFKTKRDAADWERQFMLANQSSLDMTLETFAEVYFRDKEMELKERTKSNKKYIISTHVIPYLGNKKMSEITPKDIIAWQKEIQSKDFSDSYLRMVQNQVTSLFTHASKIYDLKENPCKKVKKMGRSDARKIDFWTKEEYDKFIQSYEVGSRLYVLFEILFWTGCRVGEALALTKDDINFNKNQINICKTYYRSKGEDIITTPKTEQSIRTIEIPMFLTNEIKDYINHLYDFPGNERLFPIVHEAVQHTMKYHSEKVGIKKIRVHDLRHSHVAYLIEQGVDPLIIKERLGHKDIKITLNTYGHLYPSKQRSVADMLNNKKNSDDGNHQSSDVTAD